MKINKILLGLTALCLSTTADAKEIATNAALMQTMDKITGRVNKVTIPVNSKIAFGDFSLVLRACKKRPPEETPENFAFIDVADKSFGTDEYNIFRGWVVSSTPGINAIEHPIYDVWLLECVDTKVDESKLLTPTELASRDKLPSKADIMDKVDQDKQEVLQDKPVEKIEESKVIRIKGFILENTDIEKNIKSPTEHKKGIKPEQEIEYKNRERPANLLDLTKDKNKTADDNLSDALDAEIEELEQY